MKSIIQQEFQNICQQKLVYPVRLYCQVLGLISVSQWLFSFAYSWLWLGEIQVIWTADWVYHTSYVVWLIYLITIIMVGQRKSHSSSVA